MRSICPLCICGLALMLISTVASAQSSAQARVVVVAEGAPIGPALREQLQRQYGKRITSMAQLAALGEQPVAVVSVESEPGKELRVLYLDYLGRSEVLAIPMSIQGARLVDVAFGLASALLARHLPALDHSALAASRGRLWESFDVLARQRQWVAHGWLPPGIPRTAMLRVEDF